MSVPLIPPAEPPNSHRRHAPKTGAGQYSGTNLSSSVQHLETKSPAPTPEISHPRFGSREFDSQPATAEEQRFRHSGWAVRRHQIYKALLRTHRPDARIDRFCNCGAGAQLQVSQDGNDLRYICMRCKDRWCAPCCSERSAGFAERVAQQIAGKTTRFITLTLRHSNTPLAAQIDRLYRSFAALRRRATTCTVFEGGAAFLEPKRNRANDGWHPHLHIITEGTYIDQRDLSRTWHEITGDSSIVDIRRVHDNADVARYVCKYVTKPADPSVFACPDALDEMITALAGRRLCMTFGTWRGIRLDADPPDAEHWITIGSVDTLRSNAAAGDVNAIRYMEAAQRKWPLFAHIWSIPPPEDLRD